jgi:hypothetical protein
METGLWTVNRRIAIRKLHFGDSNGSLGADLYAGLAAQALVHVNGLGFPVNQLIDLSRTSIDAFAIAGTFVFVNIYLPHNLPPCD